MASYKVIGVGEKNKFFDEDSYRNVINYIINPVKAAYVGGANVSSMETAAEEMQYVAEYYNKDFGKRLRHSVLSFEEDWVTAEMANNWAMQIIEFYAPEYQIVFAVHCNTDNIHIHFVMNHISFVDGHRYRGKKKDYYDFQGYIRQMCGLPVKLVKNEPECGMSFASAV